jgi:hypothetical protein
MLETAELLEEFSAPLDHELEPWLEDDFPQDASTDLFGEPIGLKVGYVKITEGNIRNHHIYLAKVMALFPADVLGGCNKVHAAPFRLRICWGNETVDTDIDATKRMFRGRGWVAKFFKENRIAAGDEVMLERTGPYCFRVSKVARRATAVPSGPPAADFQICNC